MGLHDILNEQPSQESAFTSCAHLTWHHRDAINHATVTIIAREENIHGSERIISLYQEGEETDEKSTILAGILPSNFFLSTELV